MFDDIIKEKANKHEAPVPPGAWDNIVKQKRKRRFPFFWWTSAILLLAAISAGLYYNNISSRKTVSTAQKNKPASEAGKQATVNKNHSQSGAGNNNGIKSTSSKNADLKTDNETSAAKTNSQSATAPTKSNHTAAILNINNSQNKEKRKVKPEKQTSIITAANKIKKQTKGRSSYQTKNAEAADLIEEQEVQKESVTIADPPFEKKKEVPAAVDDHQQQIALNTLPVKENPNNKTDESNNTITTSPNDKKENSSNTKKSKHHPWFLEVSAAPLLPIQQYDQTVSFNRTLFFNNGLSVFSAKLVKTSVEPTVAFQLSVKKQISSKLSLSVGLQYVRLTENISISGIETNTTYSVVNRLVYGSSGPILVTDSVATVIEGTRNINGVNSYRLISLPILAQYQLMKKESWSIGAVGGLYVNISSSYKNVINNTSSVPLTVTPVPAEKSSVGMDIFAGLRLGKTVGRKIDFFAMPSVRWNLSKYSIKNSLLTKTINQAGLSVGICYKMK